MLQIWINVCVLLALGFFGAMHLGQSLKINELEERINGIDDTLFDGGDFVDEEDRVVDESKPLTYN